MIESDTSGPGLFLGSYGPAPEDTCGNLCRRAATAPRSPKAAAPSPATVWPQAQVAAAAAEGDGVLPPCLAESWAADDLGEFPVSN